MKVKQLIGDRFKEKPTDATLTSHALLIRGGYIKQMSNGIFSLLPPAKRVMSKIEAIIRDEMDSIDGQEVSFPIMMPASLWEESGRYSSIGKEMFRLNDRHESPMVLGMTHEEASVHMVREYANSYARYPFMIYQFQTKFRDEARPRGGLIRVREFIMKDAYSFHASREDLVDYYNKAHKAYENIFARVGLSEVVSVFADSGMMGGSVSHEFMLLTDAGEDTIVICNNCNYSSNMEASVAVPTSITNSIQNLEEVHTPNIKSIDDVAKFLQTEANMLCKAVIYECEDNDKIVVAFIRGDLEINECRVRNLVGSQIVSARPELASKYFTLGFVGPKKTDDKKIIMLFDDSLKGLESLVVGANKKDYHMKGFNLARDFGEVEYHSLSKVSDGGICPECGKTSIKLSRGVEVGNIFQLDTKYSLAMNLLFNNEQGEKEPAIMGCYGIGLGRLLASVAEVKNDDYGIIWPISIAPWQVHICALNADSSIEIKELADKLYSDLKNSKLDALYDDRAVRPGVMFADADLLGSPIRVIFGEKNLADGKVELVSRDKSVKLLVDKNSILDEVLKLAQKLQNEISVKK